MQKSGLFTISIICGDSFEVSEGDTAIDEKRPRNMLTHTEKGGARNSCAANKKDCEICRIIAYHEQTYGRQFKHLFMMFVDN
jgi:hypothetical protein